MSDIFISYAHEDRAFASMLAGSLERQGWTVWWDRNLVAGERFGRVIEQALESARCVIVVWSRHAVDSDWVQAEAHEGNRRGVMVPVRIDDTLPPLIFRQVQTAELANWDGSTDIPDFETFINDVSTKLGPKQLLGSRSTEEISSELRRGLVQRKKRSSKSLSIAIAVILALTVVGGMTVFWDVRSKQAQVALAKELDLAARSTLRNLKTIRPEERGTYWWYLLSSTDRSVLMERAVLLALESVQRHPSAEAEETLGIGLGLLNKPLVSLGYEGYLPSALAFSPSADWIAAIGPKDSVRLWDVAAGKEVARLAHDESVTSLAFSPDGCLLATASYDGMARLWDTGSDAEVLKLHHKNAVFFIAFSSDGTHLATVSGRTVAGNTDAVVKVWQLPKTEPSMQLSHPMREFRGLAFSPSGRLVATVGKRTDAYLWAVDTGDQLARLIHKKPVNSIAFSPDEAYVATGGSSGAHLWNVVGGGQVREFEHRASVKVVAFGPEGSYLATGTSKGRVKIWDTREGKEMAQLSHTDRIIVIAWSPDGRHVATGSQDGTARVWEVKSGTEVVRVIHRGNVNAISFNRDGSLLATGSNEGELKVWRLWPDDLAAEACTRLSRNLTLKEWRKYLGDEPYRKTCPQLP